MLDGKKILGVIPARGGSKGIPRKNIKMLGGKPLIAWTIEQAKKSKYIDRLIVSSEDKEIQNVAKEWGCEVPFERPAELSNDDTPGFAPAIHALQMCPGFDFLVLLQPTSPFRITKDIDDAIEICILEKVSSSITIAPSKDHPYLTFGRKNDGTLSPFMDPKPKVLRRQDLPPAYTLNGAVYVVDSKIFSETKSFLHHDTVSLLMPPVRSLDIDSALDFVIASGIVAVRKFDSALFDNDIE